MYLQKFANVDLAPLAIPLKLVMARPVNVDPASLVLGNKPGATVMLELVNANAIQL